MIDPATQDMLVELIIDALKQPENADVAPELEREIRLHTGRLILDRLDTETIPLILRNDEVASVLGQKFLEISDSLKAALSE